MIERNKRKNRMLSADSDPRRPSAAGNSYRLRKPGRFFGRIGLILFLGLIVLVVAGSLRKSAAEHLPPPTENPAEVHAEAGAVVSDPASPQALNPSEGLETIPETVPVLTDAPAGFAWKELLVVLDAGHGGRDPGAVSPGEPEVLEKDITLAIIQACREKLEIEGIPVLLTRESDTELARKIQADLDVRTNMANDADASLFVSIHVNSLELTIPGARNVTGMECYYAKKENRFPPVSDEVFANRLGESMAAKTGKKLNSVIEKRLAVLRATKMPAVLVEVGYMTNKGDLDSMTSDAFRDAAAQGMVEAILRTVADMSPVKEDGIWHVLRAEPLQAGAAGG
jgi:N-acetylmuramoyl-L-alanine amidase